MNRRQFLATTSAGVLAAASPLTYSPRLNKRMGVSMATFAIRWQSEVISQKFPGFQNALDILAHCADLNAGGAQVSVTGWAEKFAGRVRDKREEMDLYLEGQIRLPKAESDIDRFEREILLGKEAGISIFRTVCLGGRRYETFDSITAFEQFTRDSFQSIAWAEKIMNRHHVKLAIENNKDWRIDEMLHLLQHFDSESIGVNLDLGNNISLLEDPMEVIEALAPYTITTHFKDMAVQKYDAGFLLAEVPLGMGLLDLPRAVALCEKHNPDVTYNLEMITRDPLKIPILSDAYWATLDHVKGHELASTMKLLHEKTSAIELISVSELPSERQLETENENNKQSFQYAENVLGLR